MKKPISKIKADGKIIEALPGTMFRVELDTGQFVTGHLAGKTNRYYIQLQPGVRVCVEFASTDPTQGNIIRVFQKFNSSITIK